MNSTSGSGHILGYPDLAGFGLRSLDMTFDDLFGAVLYQLGALDGVAHAVGASVDYVKMHGALYDRTVRDAEHAAAVISAIQAYDPGLPVLGFPGSALLETAREAGHPVVGEAYPGRAYLPDGTLVPRTQEGALLQDAGQIAGRAVRLATKGEIEAVDGTVHPRQAGFAVPAGGHPGIRGHRRRRAQVTGGRRGGSWSLSPDVSSLVGGRPAVRSVLAEHQVCQREDGEPGQGAHHGAVDPDELQVLADLEFDLP